MVLTIQDALYVADYDMSGAGIKLGYRNQSG